MKTILVLEGNGRDREALQALLQNHGYTVTQASDKALQVSEVPRDPEHHHPNLCENPPLATYRSGVDGKLYAVIQAVAKALDVTEPPQGTDLCFRGIYENGPLGVFRASLDGKLLSINPAGARMHKYDSPQEMIETVNRTSIAEVLYLDGQHRQEILAEILSSNDWQVYEEQFRCKDGSVIDCHFHIRAVRDADGRPIELEGFLEDISDRKRVERQLKFTQFAIDKTIDQAFWIDEQGRFVYVNDAACHEMGYSRQELLGMSVVDIDPDYTADFFSGTWQELKRHCSKTFERRHRARDGRIFPVEVRANYLVYEGQEYVCFFATDISERKQIEERLRRTNDMLRATIEAAPTAIIGLDLEGNVCNVWNPAAEKMLGWSAGEVMGRPLPSVPVESQEEFRRFREWVRSGKSLDGIEVRRQRKDGSSIDYSIYASPLKGADGSIVGNIAVLVDVTERKRTEKALKLSQFMIDRASLGICRGSDDGRILFVNDYWAQKLGYTAEELCSLSFFDIDPNLTPEFWRAHRKKLTASGSHTFESVHRRKDGTEFPVEVTVNYHTYGEQVFSCSFATDISERKQAERALHFTQFAIDKTSDQAFWTNEEGRFFYVNEAACAVLGYSRAELEGMAIWDINPTVSPENATGYWQQLKEKGSVRFESLHRAKDGRIYPVEIRCNYVQFDGKEYNCAFVTDFSERQQAEEALRESECKYRSIVEHAPFGITRSTRDGKLLSVNPALAAMLKYDSAQELQETINRSSIQDVLFPQALRAGASGGEYSQQRCLARLQQPPTLQGRQCRHLPGSFAADSGCGWTDQRV